MWQQFKAWFTNEDGPTAVEYAVMLALIVSACMFAVSLLGSNVSNTLTQVSASMNPPAAASSSTSRSAAAAPAAPAAAP